VNLIGQRIGSYIVERELGAGGTGTVYACRHTMIEREVAVKVLHDEQARDPDQVARFFQEAKAAAEIGHPNIIVIIDYGSLETPEGSRTYVMMESLAGQSLDKRLRRGGLSLEDIRHILAQTASALVACHGKGIIHRDLKPSNLFLCERSFDPMFVKVLDFGTAKLAAPAPGLRRTQLGVVIGTPAYMSPEQCEGKGAIDHRSDVYSLGVMLYEMLTGALPHDGELGDILIGHLHRTPAPPRERNPNIPPEWEALCLRMMEKPREARFQSITQLAHALEDLRGHAAAYFAHQEERARRAEGGHSGHTLVASAPNAPPHPPTSAARPTLQVDVGPGPAPVPATGAHVPATGSFDLRGPCAALVVDPRHGAFSRALMLRPPGRWFELAELCNTAQVAPPAAIATDLGLFVTWVEHPYPDPSLAAVVFLSLRSGWSTVVLCPRVR
jgi:serine/threonine-protein kinase